MIHLVIGKKNVGKTTRLKQLFGEHPDAWGFCSEKIHDCGRVTAYNLVNLRTGEVCESARLTSLPKPEDWGDELVHGPFRFALDGFEWAMDLFRQAKAQGATTFFIDELGKIELKGDGHAELIRQAMKTGMDLFIAVRDRNVSDAKSRFGITEFNRIDIDE